MIKVNATGLQAAIAGSTQLRNLLGPAARVELGIADAQVEKLWKQASAGRDVVTVRPQEYPEVHEIIKSHVEAVRDSQGRVSGSRGDWRKMYEEIGEWLKELIAAKIEDVRRVPKAALSPAYAEWKRRRYGELPILHATGEMLLAVVDAVVKVTRR